MEVLALIQSKTRCLKKFLKISESFLGEAQSGDFSRLTEFHEKRDKMLRAFELYDRKISQIVTSLPQSERTPKLIESVKSALVDRDQLLIEVLKVDAKIIEQIEEAKKKILKELAASRKSKQIVQKFKSGWIGESGEELDQKL
jgi:GTP1/Obg family GTP-binding protein